MDSNRSQTKVLFAYQMQEDLAHAHGNHALDKNSTATVIRVVQYLNLGAYFNDSQFAEGGTGRGSLKTDFLSSAIITSSTVTYKNQVGKITDSAPVAAGDVQKIVPCLYKNYRIVDIVLNPAGSIQSAINAQNHLIGVVIGLQFDSGTTDDLFLTMKKFPMIAVDLDSANTRNAGNVVGPLVDSSYGGVGSIEIIDLGQNALDAVFGAFSWAKYYKAKRLESPGLLEPSCFMRPDNAGSGANTPTHTTFWTGWGIASPQLYGATSTQSWAQSNNYYASPRISVMRWFSGRSDMTVQMFRAPEAPVLSLGEESDSTIENNPLGRFFGISSAYSQTTHDVKGEGLVSYQHDNIYTSWGQHFGWLTTPPGFVLRDRNGNILTSERVWGTPPAFLAAVNPGRTHAGISADQKLTDPDNDFFELEQLSKSWFGSFPDDVQGYMESGDAQSGSAGSPVAPGAGSSAGTSGNIYTRDPLKRRYARIFYRIGGGSTDTSGNNGRTLSGLYGGGTSGESAATNMGKAQRFAANSSNGGAWYVHLFTRDYVLPGYMWLNARNDGNIQNLTAGGNTIAKTGSLRDIRMTRGVNFFYTGATKETAGDIVYSPVFKGHGKYVRITRYSSFGVPNLNGLGDLIFAKHVEQGIENPLMDYGSLNESSEYDPDGGDSNYKMPNGIDLLFNAMYGQFAYPDSLSTYGSSGYQWDVSQNLGLKAVVIDSYYGNGGSFTNTPVTIGPFQADGEIQDIAYLVEGFNRVNVSSSSSYAQAIYCLNHPIESAWSDAQSMSVQVNTYDNLVESVHRPFQHGPGEIDNIKETASSMSRAIYSAAPVGGHQLFTPPPIGLSSNFGHVYTDAFYSFGLNADDYPNGTAFLTGRHLKLPHINPAQTQQRDAFILSSTTGEKVIEILSQSVVVQNFTGTGGTDSGFPQASANNQNLEIKFVMHYRYVDQDTTLFQTSSGSRLVEDAALSTRVTKVLEIWNHIEVIPLAKFSEDAAVNSFGVNGEPSFAYNQVISSADHVDDIRIEAADAQDHYRLVMTIRADEDDVYNNPDYEIGAEDQAFTAIIPDVPYDSNFIDYRAGVGTSDDTMPAWYKGYSASDTDRDNGSSKASFIVVAHTSTWEDTNDIAVGSTETIGMPKENSYVIQTPYVTYGGFTQPDVEVFEEVPGCTDPDAINFNADANTDDGSCIFCGDTLLNAFDNNSIDSGWNVGAYKHDDDHHMFNGTVAGLGSFYSGTLPANASGIPYIGSHEMARGGTVMCNNAFIGNTAGNPNDGPALCNLSIKAAPTSTMSANFGEALQIIEDQYSGIAEDCWKIKIYPMSDAIADAVPFTSQFGLNVQPVISASNAPSAVTSASPIYSAYANGGTLASPEWNLIATEDTGGFGGNLLPGNGYLIELIFDPNKIDAVACASFLNKNYRMYGMFWTAFCSCAAASTGNDYYALALNGNGYSWNDNFSFPVLPYGSGNASDCPDPIPGGALDDGPYYGNAPNADNATICFQADDEIANCESYFLACVVGPDVTCYNLQDIQNGIVEPIQVAANTFQFPFTASIEFNLEGVYDSQANQLVVSDDITYTVQVTGPGGYNETQTQADSEFDPVNYPFYINTFDSITEVGQYVVNVTLNGPYPNDIVPEMEDGTHPCTDTFTIQVENFCSEYIVGCTDPTADNYDPNATVDNGSCEFTDDCADLYLNDSVSTVLTSTQSTSSCGQDTITFEGQTYEINVPVPNNDGTITATVNYEQNEGAITQYAVAVIAGSDALVGIINNTAEAIAAVFANYPTSTTEGVDLTGTAGSQIAFWSPLQVITDVPNPNPITFTGLAPGNYLVLVVPDVQLGSLDPTYVECEGEPFIKFEDYIDSIFVGQAAAPDCEEECLNPPCIEYTYGCTNPGADNYDPDADYDDGSCVFAETFCEQNPNDPLCEDCTSANEEGGAQSRGVGTKQVDGTIDETVCDPTVGTDGECTDPNACNYNPNAPLDVSNNLLCDYCSCIEDPEDPDCYGDTDCDPAVDPNCGPPEPECPDPSNPLCDPEPFDPCPLGDCTPPGDPCLILGNCGETTTDDPEDFPDFVYDDNPIEVTCLVDIDTVDNSELGFSAVQDMAFKCMGEEGSKLLFKLKAGVDCSEEELTKLSLIAYLFSGGLEKTLLPCLFNCNYESRTKLRETNCVQKWVAGGARVWNGVDTFQKGDYCVYYYTKNGVVTRAFYEATRDIEVRGLQPRYAQSGWHRCQDVKLRKADRNGIADGTENYLTVMYEYLTRYCTSCQIGGATQRDIAETQAINNVDLPNPEGYLPPKKSADQRNNFNNGSGILGEDGEEIIF